MVPCCVLGVKPTIKSFAVGIEPSTNKTLMVIGRDLTKKNYDLMKLSGI
jgi:hypothetical protein